jgi:hypothetical protein
VGGMLEFELLPQAEIRSASTATPANLIDDIRNLAISRARKRVHKQPPKSPRV